jgi:hypothetical protein
MTVVGDLVVIQDKQKFRDSLRSFHNKWTMATAMGMAMATKMLGQENRRMLVPRPTPESKTREATAMAMEMAMGMGMAAVTEKETGKHIKLKYYGHGWKPFDQIVGIVTEITPEEHPDFDVIKIREQTGGVRYCRRFIIEGARD